MTDISPTKTAAQHSLMQPRSGDHAYADSAVSWASEDIAYAAGFARVAMELHDARDLAETIARARGIAQRVVPCDANGLMLRSRENRFHTAMPCDPRVAEADQLQVSLGEGPWLSRESHDRGILILDTAVDARWPHWGPQVARFGLRSLLSVRLRTRQSDLGLLNFYSASPGRFAEADNAAARLLASQASVAIATAREAETLALAVKGRAVIGQAHGILMERFGLDADQAFAVLQRYSQDSNVKLRDVATRFVATRQLPARPESVPSSRT